MASKHKTLLHIREMQIQITARYHYTPISMGKKLKKKTNNTKCEENRSNWNSYTLLVGMQNGTAILENCLIAFYKGKCKII